MELETVVQGVPAFSTWSHTDRVKLFAWFFHTYEKKEYFEAKDIKRCFDQLHLDPPSSISPLLISLGKKKPKEVLKTGAGYRLEKRVRDYFDSEYGRRPGTLPGHALPFEIDRFPQTIAERVPDCDPVIIQFVEEAIRCFRADAFLGCAFMIGAASERAIGLLIQVFGDCIADEGNRNKYVSKMNNRMISKKFEEFSACYKGCKSRPATDAALSQDLEVLIGSMFQFCRITRNEVGHPQIVPDLDKGVLLANLGHVVTYLERIYGLIHHFQQTGVVL